MPTIWEQLLAKKHEFIGGLLIDLDNDPLGRPMPAGGFRTTITDITLTPPKPGAVYGPYFEVHGADFICGGATAFLAVEGREPLVPNAITLIGYAGHQWEFAPPTRH